MSVSKRTFLIWWIGGLAAFAGAIYLHLPLAVAAVPGGIVEHQAAPDAQAVNAIHVAWKDAGVFGQASVAMVADLAFIVIYATGAAFGGRYFMGVQDTLLRRIGGVVALSAWIFLFADLGETTAQLVQVLQDAGSDQLALIASTLQPVKSISFVASFLGLAIALVLEPLRAA